MLNVKSKGKKMKNFPNALQANIIYQFGNFI